MVRRSIPPLLLQCNNFLAIFFDFL